MTAIAPHITAFLRERLPQQRGASEHTCQSYAYAFQLLFLYASERFHVKPSALALEQLDAPLIMDFLEQLETKRGNTASTRNARLAAIKSFMRFCEYREPAVLEQSRCILAIPFKRTDVTLIDHLNIAEMEAILNAPDLKVRDGLRDRAMLHLCFSAGLRVSELVSLPLAALDLRSSPSICARQRAARALPASVETRRHRSSGLVGAPRRGVRTGGVPQRAQPTDDPFRVRVHSAQACAHRLRALSIVEGKADLSTRPEAYLRNDDPAGHRRPAESLIVVGSRGHAND